MKDYFRPLRITHEHFGYTPEMSLAEKTAYVEARIKDLKNKGFGGLVTNVHGANYLHDEDEWQLMREKVRICRENDMRMWLYDEKGYPSGGAWTETLKADPDYEARAVVLTAKLLAPGETWEALLPKGHEKALGAFGYYIEGEKITEEELMQTPLRLPASDRIVFENTDKSRNLLAMAFYQKHMFEGGHCHHNVCAARRYIDVSNKDAVREFINNTYKRYADNLKDSFASYIGDPSENAVIEAIFTDEPSYMGVYINATLIPPHVDHPYDDTIPLYPVVNWGRDLANRFASAYAYRIEDHLPALFFGSGEKFCAVRRDFYQMLSDLYEQSFFAQLSDYCASVGLQFSGHILLEDELPLHVQFEGNFFKLLRHMHVPGIDMLHSIPEIIWKFAFTPLLVSSISTLYNRGHVMDEVSAHTQRNNVTTGQIYTSLMLQYVFGADIFTSYYLETYPVEEMRAIWDAISFAQSNTQNKDNGNILLHYPIETMMRLRKPAHEFAEDGDRCPGLIGECNSSMLGAMYLLLDHQVPFLFSDTDTLDIAKKRDPKLFIISSGAIEDALVSRAKALSENGCRVVYYCENSGFAEEYRKIAGFAALAESKEALLEEIRNSQESGLATGGDTSGVAALWAEQAVLLVNSDGREKELTIRTDKEVEEAISLYDRTPVAYTKENGRTAITLPPYAAVLLKKVSE